MEHLLNVVITTDNGHILRNATVASFEEVAELHRKFPRRLLGVFAGEEMWLWVPEMRDWE